jgi:hypothetical protein
LLAPPSPDGRASIHAVFAVVTCPPAERSRGPFVEPSVLVFGIPLSVGAILSGITLGLGTRWGVFRYPWVVTKLLLIVSVMVVGGVVIGPAIDAMLQGRGDTTAMLIAAAAYDVLALALATVLGVFKPGRPFRARHTGK